MIDWMSVEINDDHIAALRLFLQDGPIAWEQLQQQEMATDESAAPYMQMFQAAFAVAVGRRFPSTYTIHEIVRYIAKLRIKRKEYSDDDFNPRVAENAIRTVLGDKSLSDEDKTDTIRDVTNLEHMVSAQTAILFDVLLAYENSSAGWLEEFVRDTVELARRWVRELQNAQVGQGRRPQAAVRSAPISPSE